MTTSHSSTRITPVLDELVLLTRTTNHIMPKCYYQNQQLTGACIDKHHCQYLTGVPEKSSPSRLSDKPVIPFVRAAKAVSTNANGRTHSFHVACPGTRCKSATSINEHEIDTSA
jgi:hypothetical protein